MFITLGSLLSNLLGIALLIYVWREAKAQNITSKQRWGLVVMGFVILIPIIIVQTLLGFLFDQWSFLEIYPLLGEFFLIPIRLALTEECFKFLGTLLVVDNKHKQYSSYQSLLLPTLTGLAFGLLENVLFVAMSFQQLQDNFWMIILMRFLIGAPGHGAYGVISGFYYAKANQSQSRSKWLTLAILVPTSIHGIYNWLSGSAILQIGSGYLLTYIMVALDFAIILVAFYKLYRYRKANF